MTQRRGICQSQETLVLVSPTHHNVHSPTSSSWVGPTTLLLLRLFPSPYTWNLVTKKNKEFVFI